jgi:hypothetical protein
MKKKQVVLIQTLLANPQKDLLEKRMGGAGARGAIEWLIENDKREDLARCHRLFSLVTNGLAPVALSFKQYVTDRGSKIVDERVFFYLVHIIVPDSSSHRLFTLLIS